MQQSIASMAQLVGELESMLRLRSFPVGLKRLGHIQELEELEFKGWKTFAHQPTGCQYITMARTIGWSFALTPDRIRSCGFAWAMGLGDEPAPETAGGVVGTWFECFEDARKWRAGFPRVEGKIAALLMAPVSHQLFLPEVVWVYGSPSQFILLINAIQWSSYERLDFSTTGESSCMDAPHQCYVTGKPALSLPCYGERWFGGAKEEELSMALPAAEMESILRGLKALYQTGYRYPIPSTSSETSVESAMAKMYGPGKREEREKAGKSFWD